MAAGGVKLTLDTPGLKDVERRLAGVWRQIKHPIQLMKVVGAVLESSTRTRFRTGLDPEGRPWKPSIRAKLKGGHTLFEHGRLRDSITHDAGADRAEVGSNLIYAAIHQVGGVIRAKGGGYLKFRIPGVGWRQVRQVTIPARPYLGVSERDRVELASQVERYVQRSAA